MQYPTPRVIVMEPWFHIKKDQWLSFNKVWIYNFLLEQELPIPGYFLNQQF